MSWAINQNCRDANGNIYSDIVEVSKQLVDNGPPAPELGVNGNVYTDALTGQQYQKQNGQWVLTVDLASVSGGSVLVSGTNIEVQTDTPAPGQTTINNTQALFEGQGITLNRPPAPSGDVTIENTGLLNVVDVGLPAYGSIASRSQPTGPADVEIKKFGAGSNIVLTNDANGVLVATTADPEFTTVRANDRVNFGDPVDGITIARVGANLQLYSGANLINMAGTQTIIDSTIRKQAPPFAVDLGTNEQPFNNLYVVNPPIVTSDSRWKTDIQPFNMGLDFVNKLEPKSYRMADETEDGQTLHHKRRRCGLIAQDVHAALISSGCDTSMCDILHNEKYDEDIPVEERLDKYMMSYSSLIPVLINAVKELSAKVAVLESV